MRDSLIRLFQCCCLLGAFTVPPGMCQEKVVGPVSAVQSPATPRPTVQSKWAILIGVDDYVSAKELNYAGRDMEDLKQRLIAMGFPPDHVFLLSKSSQRAAELPFRSNIEHQLDVLIGRLNEAGTEIVKPGLVGKGDLVIVGFSGHGVHFEKEGSFLCPTDARLDYPKSLVSVDGIFQRLANCEAAAKLVLVDACRNEIHPDNTRVAADQQNNKNFAKSLQTPPKGVMLMSSCSPGQLSWEDHDFRHGVFMNFVLKGLDGEADQALDTTHPHSQGNANGQVSLQELFGFASRSTQAFVAQQRKVEQLPTFRLVGDDRFFELELGTYSHTLPFPAFFTIRENGTDGPPAAKAEIALAYSASANDPPVVMGRARTDDQGKAQITVNLKEAERQRGRFLATVNYQNQLTKSDLPGFLETRNFTLYVDRGSPLAERVRELNTAGKFEETLKLVWLQWKTADPQVRQAFADAGVKVPRWWIAEASRIAETISDPYESTMTWTIIAASAFRERDTVLYGKATARAAEALKDLREPLDAVDAGFAVARIHESLGRAPEALAALEQVQLAMEGIPKTYGAQTGAAGWIRRHSLFRIEVYSRLAGIARRLKSSTAEAKYAEIAMSEATSAGGLMALSLAQVYAATLIHGEVGDFATIQQMVNGSGGNSPYLRGQRGAEIAGRYEGLAALHGMDVPLDCALALNAARYGNEKTYQTAIRRSEAAAARYQPPSQQDNLDRVWSSVVQADGLMGKLDSAAKRVELIVDTRIKHEALFMLGQSQLMKSRTADAQETLDQFASDARRVVLMARIVQALGKTSDRDLPKLVDWVLSRRTACEQASGLCSFAQWPQMQR